VRRDPYARLSRLLRRLERAGLRYTVTHYRDDAPVSLQVAVPGERWEIDLLPDGRFEFERFVSGGDIGDLSELLREITKHSTPVPGPA
jgi:hypothetical protein